MNLVSESNLNFSTATSANRNKLKNQYEIEG